MLQPQAVRIGANKITQFVFSKVSGEPFMLQQVGSPQTYTYNSQSCATLVAPYRSILRCYRCDTRYHAIHFQGG